MIDYGSSQSKKQYTRRIGDNGFLGADFSTAPIFASPRRFRDLKNVWKDYKSGSGVAIETIPGYREFFSKETATGKVNGIGFFQVTEESPAVKEWLKNNSSSSAESAVGTWIVAHIGTSLVVCKKDNLGENGDVTNKQFVAVVVNNAYYASSLGKMPNLKSTIVQFGQEILLMTGTKIFRIALLTVAMALACGISLATSAACPAPFIAGDMESTVTTGGNTYNFNGYIPTTYIDGEPYEQKNMLNTRSREIYNVTTTASNEEVVCVLHEKVRVEHRYDPLIGATVVYPTTNILSVYLDGIELARTAVSCSQMDNDYDWATVTPGFVYRFRIQVASAGTHQVQVVYNADPTIFTSYLSYEDYKNRTTFNEGNPNYGGSAFNAIKGCTICATFDERVFLAGNPGLPNTVFYSQRDLTGYNNPTYFGVLNYNNLGTSNAPITALVPSANVLYALKDDSTTDPTMYVLTGQTTEIDLLPRIYTVESGLPGIGCKGAACNFLDDIVFMSKNGVIGIDKQAVNLERTLGDRSVLINGRLTREDPTKAIFAEWEGYLAVLFTNNGHLYLADSRAYTQGAGYEWYFVDSVGTWESDDPLYTYTNDYVGENDTADIEDRDNVEGFSDTVDGTAYDFGNGTHYTVTKCPNAGAQYVGSVTTVYLEYTETREYDDRRERYIVTLHKNTAGKRVILAETDSGDYYQVETTGELVGGTFHPATCMVALNDRILFGTADGKVLTFNTDKRGVQASTEGSHNFAPDMIRPEWYTFCGHRIESYVETEDDDAGVANATKDTVKRSVVVDLKALLGSRYKVTTYTDRDNWQDGNAATGAINDLSNVGLGAMNFKGDEHVIVQIRERARKWVHKRYRVESNGFKAPFGLYRITYNFEINGRIK